jgi:peptidoglycan glycosyltransferase
MLRRHAIASLLAAGAWGRDLSRFFEGVHGSSVLVDRKTRRLLSTHAPELAAGWAEAPGSTLKPLVLNALLERGLLRPNATFTCPRELRLAGRRLDCSHPPLNSPLTVRTAIAYSCNCFVAHFAARFRPGELAAEMARWGLASRTGWFDDSEGTGRVREAPVQLQALGEAGVVATPAGLAMAYCHLASQAVPAVFEGMADAVSFGTAQRAQVPGLKISGKTGSVRTPSGAYLAWFAGFTDAAVVTVMLHGRSGGSDAAPVGGRILEAHWKGQA